MFDTSEKRIKLQEILKQALQDIAGSAELWQVVDDELLEFLNKSECFVSVGNPDKALVGLGDADVTVDNVAFTITYETYNKIEKPWPAHKEDIECQIAGCDKLISKLEAIRGQLKKELVRKWP